MFQVLSSIVPLEVMLLLGLVAAVVFVLDGVLVPGKDEVSYGTAHAHSDDEVRIVRHHHQHQAVPHEQLHQVQARLRHVVHVKGASANVNHKLGQFDVCLRKKAGI